MVISLFSHFDSYESPFSPIKFKIFGELSVPGIPQIVSGNFTSKLGCLDICNEKYQDAELPSTRDMMILSEHFVDIGQDF